MAALALRTNANQVDIFVSAQIAQALQMVHARLAELEAVFVVDLSKSRIVTAQFLLGMVEIAQKLFLRRESADKFLSQLLFQKARVEPHSNHYVRPLARDCAVFDFQYGSLFEHWPAPRFPI